MNAKYLTVTEKKGDFLLSSALISMINVRVALVGFIMGSSVSHKIRLFIIQIYTCFATWIWKGGKIVGTLGRAREEYFYSD